MKLLHDDKIYVRGVFMPFSKEEIYEIISPIARTCNYHISYPSIVKKGRRAKDRQELDLIINANIRLKSKPTNRVEVKEENKFRRSKKELAYRSAIMATKAYKEWKKTCKENGKTSGTLYLVVLSNEEESFVKVGITTTTIKRRFREIPYKYRTARKIEFNNITDLYIAETMIHDEYKKKKYCPVNKFSGYTECYGTECKKSLMKHFRKYANLVPDEKSIE